MKDSESAADFAAKPAREAQEAGYRALLARVARGEEAALAEFYDATAPRVYALARRIGGDVRAAEEVTADVYLQVWQQADRYDPARGKALSWLLTICRSRALDERRRRDAAEAHPQPHELRPDLYVEDAAPSELLSAIERNSRVYAALEQLNAAQRRLIALAFFRGLSHREIAAHTGMPLGSVKTVLRTALHALKAVLAPALASSEDCP